jgi:hypothetical protein
MTVCTRCWGPLTRKRKPALAIANGFAIGSLPDEFSNVTEIEADLVCNTGTLNCVRL